MNILLTEQADGLTGDVPVTVKLVRYLLLQETACLHKVDGLSLHSGDESGGHVTSKASCLCSGMTLIRVSNDSTVLAHTTYDEHTSRTGPGLRLAEGCTP